MESLSEAQAENITPKNCLKNEAALKLLEGLIELSKGSLIKAIPELNRNDLAFRIYKASDLVSEDDAELVSEDMIESEEALVPPPPPSVKLKNPPTYEGYIIIQVPSLNMEGKESDLEGLNRSYWIHLPTFSFLGFADHGDAPLDLKRKVHSARIRIKDLLG